MTEVIAASTDAQRLLSEILARYSSLDAFIAQLQSEFDAPTVQLPRVRTPIVPNWADPTTWPTRATPSGGHGRHARADD
ncbi:hypothetical protein HLB23_01760 [Nocardia uniformis]|uniref:Uncharacterized protein n=1 Tax=Nocardia uniformis TaxID=53432 RepID=A0A849BY69_9NOCA|nr:hypothetical protein [Nocardia uniformis]NNH68617.1 hypothetical protein [Nocardia uniformis]